MNLQEKIDNIFKTSKLTKLEYGKSNDLESFWLNFIEPHLPHEEAIVGWHKILMKYIHDDNIIFSLRIFGTYVNNNKDSSILRRGFISTTNQNFSVVYVDNFFTSYFFSMAYDNYIPLYSEFKEMMNCRKFPAGYMSTKAEDKYRGFSRGKNPGIQSKGYKIAHIYDAGRNFNFEKDINTVGKFCNLYFPRGKYEDWNMFEKDKTGIYHYRNIHIKDADKQRVYKFLVAHFLRTVHPLNYFLVPKRGYISFYDSGLIKDEIGEYSPLIKYVEQKIRQKYKRIYKEYIELIAPISKKENDLININIDAEYGVDNTNKVIAQSAIYKSPNCSSVLKIGEIVKKYIFSVLEEGKITGYELQKLQDKEYSKQIFDINYPLLSKVRIINGQPRYYANRILINNEEYYICQEWFDKSRQKLVSWLKDHGVVIED